MERLFDWGLLTVPEPVIAVFGIWGLALLLEVQLSFSFPSSLRAGLLNIYIYVYIVLLHNVLNFSRQLGSGIEENAACLLPCASACCFALFVSRKKKGSKPQPHSQLLLFPHG